jgi:hypothetical protein
MQILAGSPQPGRRRRQLHALELQIGDALSQRFTFVGQILAKLPDLAE